MYTSFRESSQSHIFMKQHWQQRKAAFILICNEISYGLVMMRFLILTNILITVVSSFSTNSILTSRCLQQKQQQSFVPIHQTQRRKVTFLSSTSRDEEIAKLEAQLRQLRESETSPDNREDDLTTAAKTATIDPDDERTLKEFAEARRRLEKVKGKDMLLTEQELIKGGLMEDSSSGSLGGVVPAVAVVIAAFVGLIAFAQIPIGQEDLARYSATGSSTLKSIDLGDLNPDVANKL